MRGRFPMMRSRCVVIVRLFCLCLFVVALTADPGRAAPRVKVDSESVNLGQVPEGEDALHEFLVSNGGDAPLVIKPRPC